MTSPPRQLSVSEGYVIPSLGYRILAGGLRLVPLLVLLVGVPDTALAFLSAQGISLPGATVVVTTGGIAISVLVTARYILRPTRAYGPLSVLTSAVTLAYLFVLWLGATYHITVPDSSVDLTIGYARLFGLLLLVPALALVAGFVTTVEDLRSPGERLPFDFPP